MVDWWEFSKSLAGPIATVMAAAAAVRVTWQLGKAQMRIAQSQANTAQAQREIAKSQLDIAFDKLKYDLFRQRYEIYTAAKGIMERVIRTGTERPIDDYELLNMRIKLDEGRFFFPAKEVLLFVIPISDVPHAPFIFYEAAPAFGVTDGVVDVILSANRTTAGPDGIVNEQVGVAYLPEGTSGGAIDKGLLLATPTGAGAAN
jgi:hypothetical protein